MKDVLGDYRYEIEAVVTEDGQEQYRLVFPEYFEEAVENTPGREIQMEVHGTGYKYRQCFKERQIDLQRYDTWFYEASVQEFPVTVLRLAFDRLLFPEALFAAVKEKYLAYLQREYRRTADFIFCSEQQDPDGTGMPQAELLSFLDRTGYFSEEILDEFIRAAGRSQNAEAVSLLLQIRRERFPAKRKRYVL